MSFKDLMTYIRILIRCIYTSVISWCLLLVLLLLSLTLRYSVVDSVFSCWRKKRYRRVQRLWRCRHCKNSMLSWSCVAVANVFVLILFWCLVWLSCTANDLLRNSPTGKDAEGRGARKTHQGHEQGQHKGHGQAQGRRQESWSKVARPRARKHQFARGSLQAHQRQGCSRWREEEG